jgi:chromosome segregation ATPase
MTTLEELTQKNLRLKNQIREIKARAKEINIQNENLKNRLESQEKERKIEKERWKLEKKDLSIRIDETNEKLAEEKSKVRELKNNLSKSQQELTELETISKDFYQTYRVQTKKLDDLDDELFFLYRQLSWTQRKKWVAENTVEEQQQQEEEFSKNSDELLAQKNYLITKHLKVINILKQQLRVTETKLDETEKERNSYRTLFSERNSEAEEH